MGEDSAEKLMAEIQRWVEKRLKDLDAHQLNTLKALVYAGYKGEREKLLIELLRALGEREISESPFVESFTSIFEDGAEERYWRIKPEFYRVVRRELLRSWSSGGTGSQSL